MKGQEVLDAINAVRSTVGLGPLGAIELEGSGHNDRALCVTCALNAAAQCNITVGCEPGTCRTRVFRFDEHDRAVLVAAATGVPVSLEEPEAATPMALDSLCIADAYGLTFVDDVGRLRGWIEPSDDDPTRWDLHLMPGYGYPPGHSPSVITGERLD